MKSKNELENGFGGKGIGGVRERKGKPRSEIEKQYWSFEERNPWIIRSRRLQIGSLEESTFT